MKSAKSRDSDRSSPGANPRIAAQAPDVTTVLGPRRTAARAAASARAAGQKPAAREPRGYLQMRLCPENLHPGVTGASPNATSPH